MGISRNTIVLGGVALMIFAFLLFVFRPLKESTGRFREEIQGKRVEITETMQLASQFAALQREQGRIDAFLRKHAKTLPQVTEIPGILGTITNLASQSNVRVLEFTPQPRKKLAFIGQTELRIKATGKFNDIHQFAHQLERVPAGIWIRSCTLSRQNEGKGVLTELNLVIFSSESDIAGSESD